MISTIKTGMLTFATTGRLLTLSLVLVLAGCSVLPEAAPADSMHMLEWRGDVAGRAAERSGVLQVAMPVAYPGYDSSYIRYRRGNEAELRRYARNRWVERPAILIGAAITEAVDDRGPYRRVGPPGNPIVADHRLESDLIRLEQVFENGESRVYLSLRYRLLEAGTGRVIGSVRHQLERSTSGDPEGAVAAANALLNQSLERLAGELADWNGSD